MGSAKKEQGEGQSSKYGIIIALVPAFGYFLAHRLMKDSDMATHTVMYFAFALFAVVLAYFAVKFLHKYAFMKANMRFVSYEKSEEELLPIGSIVMIDGKEKKIMIYGRKMLLEDEDEEGVESTLYDYIGVLYPEGGTGSEYGYAFNHDDIVKVIFKGYEGEEEHAYQDV